MTEVDSVMYGISLPDALLLEKQRERESERDVRENVTHIGSTTVSATTSVVAIRDELIRSPHVPRGHQSLLTNF